MNTIMLTSRALSTVPLPVPNGDIGFCTERFMVQGGGREQANRRGVRDIYFTPVAKCVIGKGLVLSFSNLHREESEGGCVGMNREK